MHHLGKIRRGAATTVALIGIASTAATATAVADESTSERPGAVPQIEVDAAKAELGKRLFFDPRLSGDEALSCASCHTPDKGFSDGMALSDAYPGSLGFRNTPTLINSALKAAWMHDGRLGTDLNDVTREMITETWLMNMDMRLMQERLKQDAIYVEMFKAAGLGEPSNGGARKAIPEYLKTLTSRNAPYDTGRMDEAAERGADLFFGKANCTSCHTGDRFTDDALHNTGVPENPEVFADPQRHVTYVTWAKFMGIDNYMNRRRDVGGHVRYLLADQSDVGTFMTPTLRELTHTAPYMHNGVFATLDEVVDFYDAGGGDDPHKDTQIRPLNLTEQEKADLVAFLEALSGDPLTGADHVWQEEIDTLYEAIPDWRETRN